MTFLEKHYYSNNNCLISDGKYDQLNIIGEELHCNYSGSDWRGYFFYDSDHNYIDFERKHISVYNEIINRKNIINILMTSNNWEIPKDVSIIYVKFFGVFLIK